VAIRLCKCQELKGFYFRSSLGAKVALAARFLVGDRGRSNVSKPHRHSSLTSVFSVCLLFPYLASLRVYQCMEAESRAV